MGSGFWAAKATKNQLQVKLITLFAAAWATAFSTIGQGTTSFQAVIDGPHAVPPNASTRESLGGSFTLTTGLFFSGSVGLVDYLDVTSVTVFRSTSQAALGTRLYDFTPGGIVNPGPDDPGSRQYNLGQTLNPSEASDVASGFWWVNVITPGFPNGEIRGQITAVPEPSTYASIVIGSAMLIIQEKRKRSA